MATGNKPEQLPMSFDAANPLAAALHDGRFCGLIEYEPPPEQPFESAMELGCRIARGLRKRDWIAGMTVTDRFRHARSRDSLKAATMLAGESGKAVVVCISGRDRTLEQVREITGVAAANGIRTVLAVSGDAAAPGPGGESARRPHLDSVRMLALLRRFRPELLAGAAVNPFKYNAPDVFLQYFKMARKLASGAGYLVTHSAWDMAKYQELQWYLSLREITVPVLARVHLLSLEDAARIDPALFPGVHVSRGFAAQVQREAGSGENRNSFLAVQLRRVGLQAAGCALLGYSGIQVGGIPDDQVAAMVLDQIETSLKQFETYPQWLAAWRDFHAEINFVPRPAAYYAFTGLLEPEHQFYPGDAVSQPRRSFPEPSARDRWVSGLRRLLLERLRLPERWRSRLPPRLAGAGFSLEELAACRFLNPGDCPKGLAWGACGGTRPDGMCEVAECRCFHHRVLALAAAAKALDSLETEVRDHA